MTTTCMCFIYLTSLRKMIEKSRVSWSGKEKSIVACALTFYLCVIVKDAWFNDDSYITFRTVDNFVNGYGLTWNIDERVQVYTHPLWMFLLSMVYFCLR